MTLRTLIVDDELSGRIAVRRHCRAHSDFRVIAECSSGDAALQCLRTERPDVAFLDVNMRPMTGIVLAAKLQLEEVPLIVFVTAYDRYAVQAFDLNAVDYLLKPFDAMRFRATVERVRLRVGVQLTPTLRNEMSRAVASVQKFVDTNRPSPDQDRLVVEVEGRVYFLDPMEIDFVESDGNCVCIHTTNHRYRVRCQIGELEARLLEPRFLRINRQVIVNTARIASMERGFNGEFHVMCSSGKLFTSARTYAKRISSVLLRSRGTDEN